MSHNLKSKICPLDQDFDEAHCWKGTVSEESLLLRNENLVASWEIPAMVILLSVFELVCIHTKQER